MIKLEFNLYTQSIHSITTVCVCVTSIHSQWQNWSLVSTYPFISLDKKTYLKVTAQLRISKKKKKINVMLLKI